MANDPEIRSCLGCGEEYAFMDRRAVGPFHFRIVSARSDDGDKWHLVGHWRSGVWNEGEELTLRTRDGRRIAVGTGSLEQPPNGTSAYERGQTQVKISADLDAAVLEKGCLWS